MYFSPKNIYIYIYIYSIENFSHGAKTTHGNQILKGMSSCTNQPIPVINHPGSNAGGSKAIKARDLSFKHVLFLSDCRRAARVVNNSQITSSWQEKSLMSDSDWSHLLDADFVYHSLCLSQGL